MLGFINRRLFTTVLLVLGTMLVTFALMRGMGGTPFSTVLEPHAGVDPRSEQAIVAREQGVLA